MKTKQVSIRFDETKFQFIKKKEKLETAQKVVDFLLNEYWYAFNSKWGKSQVSAEIPPVQVKKAPVVPLPISTYEVYFRELSDAETVDQIEITVKELSEDNSLSATDKFKLKNYAKAFSEQMEPKY